MTIRRRSIVCAALVFPILALARSVLAEIPRNINAFNARSDSSVLGNLSLAEAEESQLVEIEAPDVAENGANVPVEITVKAADVERVLLIGDRNVFPLLADAHFSPTVQPWLEIKVRLAETSHIRAYAVTRHGQVLTNSRQIRVIVGGCLPG